MAGDSKRIGTQDPSQPALYEQVWFLAHRVLATRVVGIGHVDPSGLAVAHPGLDVMGVLPPGAAPRQGPGRWVGWDDVVDVDVLPDPPARSFVLCAGLGWLDDPASVLRRLAAWASRAAAVLVTGDRGDRLSSTPEALGAALEGAGLAPRFLGWTGRGAARVPVAVVAPGLTPELPIPPAPETFRVTAVMTAYNEVDIIGASLDRLIDQGISVYVIDNWSTDGTYEEAASRVGRGVVAVERYPPGGPSAHYRWEALIRRVEDVAATLDADWVLHHDVDEIRMAPWPGVGLRDAIHAVDRLGFTAIDHTVLVFPPTDDGFVPGTDFGEHFRHFEFAPARDLLQIKGWKRGPAPAVLLHGGHDARFPGRRVYPFKFLLRHYPIRSQAHGERKVFTERLARFTPSELSRGWHQQYEELRGSASFVRSPSTLLEWDGATVRREYVLEILCGAASDGGIVRSVGALPSLLPGGYDVHWARKNGSDGVEYHSVEYDRGDVVYRQGTGDLASREAAILGQLDGPSFPRPVAARATEGFSVAILEPLEGPTLRTDTAGIAADPRRFYRFASMCLEILADLRRASVTHRDIAESNVVLLKSSPALHRFAWARSPAVRDVGFEPVREVPPDGVPCDVYATGRLLSRVNAGLFPSFGAVIELMTEPDRSLRITDVSVLQSLLDAALQRSVGGA